MCDHVIIFTCEHAGNNVPEEFEELFIGRKKMLNSHLGYDPGALRLAKYLSGKLSAPLFTSSVTRLLVDCNRSLHNQHIHSDFIWPLVPQLRDKIIREYYSPYRALAEQQIQHYLRLEKKVIHISIHSFTDVLDGQKRTGDIGVLFDPKRGQESAFAWSWIKQFNAESNEYDVRDNYPYLGTDDGFTTFLRNRYNNYLGIELEVKQSLLLEGFEAVSRTIENTLFRVWQDFPKLSFNLNC